MRNKDAWVDFGVCLLFGWLGIHKFRERRAGMGILYLFTFGIFCQHYAENASHEKVSYPKRPSGISSTKILFLRYSDITLY